MYYTFAAPDWQGDFQLKLARNNSPGLQAGRGFSTLGADGIAGHDTLSNMDTELSTLSTMTVPKVSFDG